MLKKSLSFLLFVLIIFETIFIKTPNFQTSERLKPTVASAADEPITEFDPTSDLNIHAPDEPSSFENIAITTQEVAITIANNNTFTINNGGTTSTSYSLTNKGINFTSIANATGKIKVTGDSTRNDIPIQIKLSGIDLHTPDDSTTSLTNTPFLIENNANVVLILGEGENKIIVLHRGIQVISGSEITITSSTANNSLYLSSSCYMGAMIGGCTDALSKNSDLIINICGCANITAERPNPCNFWDRCSSIGNAMDSTENTTINIVGSAHVTASNINSYSNATGNEKGTTCAAIGGFTKGADKNSVINIGENAVVTASCDVVGDNRNRVVNGGAAIGGSYNSVIINIGGNANVTASSNCSATNSTNVNQSAAIGGGKSYANATNGVDINIGGNSIVVANIHSLNEIYVAAIGTGSLTTLTINANQIVISDCKINIGENADVTASNSNTNLGTNSKNFGAAIGGKAITANNSVIININGNAKVLAKRNDTSSSNVSAAIGAGAYVTTTAMASGVTINIAENAKACAVCVSSGTYISPAIGGNVPGNISAINVSGNPIVVAKTYNDSGIEIESSSIFEVINLNTSITGGFVIASGQGEKDIEIANITGGSVFCKNTMPTLTDSFKNASGNDLYLCYCPKTIDGTLLQNKNILVPLEDGSTYKAPTFNDKIKEFLQSNNQADLFPENDLSACLWLPEKNSYDQIRVIGVPNKIFKSNVAINRDLYTVNPGPNNWLVPSTSTPTPPVIDENIPPPTIDTTPEWFNIKTLHLQEQEFQVIIYQ